MGQGAWPKSQNRPQEANEHGIVIADSDWVQEHESVIGCGFKGMRV